MAVKVRQRTLPSGDQHWQADIRVTLTDGSSYRESINNHLIWVLGNIFIDSLEARHMQMLDWPELATVKKVQGRQAAQPLTKHPKFNYFGEYDRDA